MKKLFVLLALAFATWQGFGQKLIKGIVYDAFDKSALPGALVREKGTENATLTDNEGRFRLVVSQQNSAIEIRFVGYEQVELPPSETLSVPMESSYKLEDVVIQGVRAQADDPVTQSTLSKKEIDRKYIGQHPLFILDELTPAIYSFSESGTNIGNYSQIRLRGIGQERVNFTLNGVPLNDMIDHGVFFSNFTDLSSNFQSVQVQRGVGMASSGAASFAGSVNFESIDLKKSDAGSNLALGVGSFGTYRANYSLNTGINDKGFGFYGSFSRLFSEGYRRHTETDAYSFFMSGGYFGEKDFLRLTAFTGRSENGLGYYTIDQSILETDRRFNNLTEDDNDDFGQHLIQLQYSRDLQRGLSWSSTLYYGGSGGDFAEGTPDVDSVFVENFSTSYNLEFFQINFPLRNDHFGVISNLVFNRGDFSLVSGIHAYTFRRENREEILPQRSNPTYFEQSKKDEFAWFAKGSYVLNQFKFFADVQVRALNLEIDPDYEFIFGDNQNRGTLDVDSWTFINPTVGVTYFLSPQLNIYGSFGIAHREPTKLDILGGFQLNANNFDLVNSGRSFEPERVNDLELGLRWNTPSTALNANFYFMDFKDEIAPIGEVIAFGLQRRSNIANSYRSGFEVDGYFLFSDRFRVSGNGAFMVTNIETVNIIGEGIFEDRKHLLSPEWILNGALEYRFSKAIASTLAVHYVGSQFMELTNNEDFQVPDWYTLDFGLTYNVTDKIVLSGHINNVFDRDYFTYGLPSDIDFSGVLEPGFLVAPPRNFYLTGNFRF